MTTALVRDNKKYADDSVIMFSNENSSLPIVMESSRENSFMWSNVDSA